MAPLGIIAGKGLYPELLLEEARAAGESRICMAAFEGETDPALAARADVCAWMRVGQLGRLLDFFKQEGVERAVMAGQITPGRLFDLRPDFKALWLLARLKERNAETLFGAVAGALAGVGVELLPATTHLERYLAPAGHVAGPKPHRRLREEIAFGWPKLKKVAAMDIGQCLLVHRGTVLAVEGYDGTNATIRRGGALAAGATLLKVSKPGQDMRFDVPVIGPDTVRVAAESRLGAIVVEAGKTLMLGLDEIESLAQKEHVTIFAVDTEGA
ncbi:MAG: UDP-2,3-diacylglucosamine diphosphatase LpxI [Candidatus Methylacidiphilales bacterium]|nr:UDP-2,3-diacylglucosamine diphosphatase LpxI [Candidatus Methylacidiphilales bacterium]